MADLTPTKPGYYWAQWLKANPGTRDGAELTPCDDWQPVQVFENALDDQSPEYLMVEVGGVEKAQSVENFVWGARVWAQTEAAEPIEPFMYGLADGNGKAVFGECCVADDPDELEGSVEFDDSIVVPLYRHPAPLACFATVESGYDATVRSALAHTSPVSAPGVVEAARGVIEQKFSTYKARNGREVGIQDDSGEKCWIVPFDAMFELEAALRSPATVEGK